MNHKILPRKVADFLTDMMPSATHRRMLHIGVVLAKVSTLFQLLPDDAVPEEATAVFILLLEGLESGNPAEYAACEQHAMNLYQEWLAGREVH